jgi:hypothetical protein
MFAFSRLSDRSQARDIADTLERVSAKKTQRTIVPRRTQSVSVGTVQETDDIWPGLRRKPPVGC